MSDYKLKNNTLFLTSKKSSLFARIVLFTLSIFSFIFPFVIIGSIIYYTENEFTFGYIIGIAVFCFIGYYFLRLALWNTYGTEIIQFGKKEIKYIADYKWFKEERLNLENEEVSSWIKDINSESGTLSLNNSSQNIHTVTEFKIEELLEKIEVLVSPPIPFNSFR